MRCVVRKVATMEGRLVWFRGGFTEGMLFLDRWTCIWHLYRFPLCYYNKAPTYYYLNILWKMQWRMVLWISGTFWMFPTLEIEAISRLIPIHLHLKKLYRRFLLWESSLLSNHIINNILSSSGSQEQSCYNASINYLTPKQRLHLKSPLINVDNKHNKFFLHFSFSMRNLNQETIL